MERWVIYAFASAVFAGCTSVIAKMGLTGITGELGLTVRTLFVFVFVLGFAAFFVPREHVHLLTRNNLIWLAASAVTTTASWIFYYKAIKAGNVSTVALIDKGSFIVAVLLAWIILREAITPRVLLGCAMIIGGLLVVARK